MQHIIDSSNRKNKNENVTFNNLVVKPPPSLSLLFKQFNNKSQTQDDKDPQNVVRCKYYDLEEVLFLHFAIILAP